MDLQLPMQSAGRWFSPSPPISSTNKTDHHDITEILLKVALNTIKQTNKKTLFLLLCFKNQYFAGNISFYYHVQSNDATQIFLHSLL
jgi:hypothetical protein